MADFLKAITKTLAKEGGSTITLDPTDRGGLTKYGISQKSYPALNIRALTAQQATDIYQRDYWDRIKGHAIPSQAVAEAIFDTCVNMGVSAGSRLAQAVVGATQDGVIGPRTLASIAAMNEDLFLAKLALVKIARYAEICQKDPSQTTFLLGWLLRTLSTAAL